MSVEWKADLRATRVLFGAGAVDSLGELVRQLGGQRVLLVTDPGIEAAGHVERGVQSLKAEGLRCFVFDGVEENPTERHVAAGVEAAREHRVDFLVGLGGGSAMDCAKGINFVFTNGGCMEDYWGMGKAHLPMLPSVGLPCTAGTGSEAQSFALISREDDHRKMACGDDKARFRAVILDPELARTAPQEVVAATGLDALSHALESFVTKARNPYSQMFAREAWRLLDGSYRTVCEESASLETWGRMLLGAHFAGAAIETSMLGAAHATANPLTAAYDITHGVAVALMLPPTVRFNGSEAEEIYRELAGVEVAGESANERLAGRIEALRRCGGLPERLRDCGVEEDRLEQLAGQAVEQWTAHFNPRAISKDDALGLYRAAY